MLSAVQALKRVDKAQNRAENRGMESQYEFVMQQLAAAKGRWPLVAVESGVSIRTLQKIARKEIQDPGVSHVEKLFRYFKSK